jgi:hypothetical protein
VDDISGNSVATAGDVNGDGMNDLIVGARGIPATTGEFKAGNFYVIFGKKDRSKSTNNQIIQAITVDIACGGD